MSTVPGSCLTRCPWLTRRGCTSWCGRWADQSGAGTGHEIGPQNRGAETRLPAQQLAKAIARTGDMADFVTSRTLSANILRTKAKYEDSSSAVIPSFFLIFGFERRKKPNKYKYE